MAIRSKLVYNGNMTNEDIVKKLIDDLDRIGTIDPDDLPNIDLYMEQVTGFIDSRLGTSARTSDGRILTKTMINNYAKNDLLPPPVKKKYSKEHLLILIFIYYFKHVMSINDIQSMLNPLTSKYFGKNGSMTIEKLYRDVSALEQSGIDDIKKDVLQKYENAENLYDGDDEEAEFLRTFTFIFELSYDIYVRKRMIESLIDNYNAKYGENAFKNHSVRTATEKVKRPERSEKKSEIKRRKMK